MTVKFGVQVLALLIMAHFLGQKSLALLSSDFLNSNMISDNGSIVFLKVEMWIKDLL